MITGDPFGKDGPIRAEIRRLEAERDEPVMVCELCGRGFLVNPGSKIDPVPIWFTADAQSEGPCLGNIKMTDRRTQIKNLDNWELSHVKERR